jgi:hypothetical protein
MRNVFQSRTATEAQVVRNLLEQNGISAQLVEKAPSFIGIACSEVWITTDADAVRKTIPRLFNPVGNVA